MTALGELAWAAVDGRSLPLRFVAVLSAWTALAALVTWAAQTRHARLTFG